MILPHTPSFRLDGRRAVVLGASRGIGLGAAVALAEAGAHTVCVARSASDLDELVTALKKAGHSAEALVADIADVPGLTAVLAGLGPLDVMVNSAGLARHGPSLDTTLPDFDAVMAVNIRGAYFAAQAAAKAMIGTGAGGSIISISSQMGVVGGIDRAVYSASKHALEGMTKAMAIEWGPHRIRVNTIGPTFIRTALTAPTFANPERLAWIQSKIKLPRIGEIEDIMGAVVFLASDASALITGTCLLVDGGWTAD